MSRKVLTTQEFTNRATVTHNGVYDYSRVMYSRLKSKVEVICQHHGSFWVTPGNHLTNKSGCPQCARSRSGNTQRVAADQTFITDCNVVHNNKYKYTKTKYINAHQKVIVTCPTHGDFLIEPYSHRQGRGCKMCSIISRATKQTLTQEEFIERSNSIHNNKYLYDDVNYVASKIKVQIICPDHGPFMQRPGSHLRGEGCPECGHYSWFAEQGGYSARYFADNPTERQTPGILYLLRFTSDKEEFYKIGITTQSIKQRYHWGYNMYNLEILEEHNTTIYEAWCKEQRIINDFKSHRYMPIVKIGGYTECLSKNIDVDQLQHIMTSKNIY